MLNFPNRCSLVALLKIWRVTPRSGDVATLDWSVACVPGKDLRILRQLENDPYPADALRSGERVAVSPLTRYGDAEHTRRMRFRR